MARYFCDGPVWGLPEHYQAHKSGEFSAIYVGNQWCWEADLTLHLDIFTSKHAQWDDQERWSRKLLRYLEKRNWSHGLGSRRYRGRTMRRGSSGHRHHHPMNCIEQPLSRVVPGRPYDVTEESDSVGSPNDPMSMTCLKCHLVVEYYYPISIL